MESVVLAVHVLVALGVIALVLIQQGKGADAGASFGSGASQTVFGSQGAGSFLTRVTAVLATVFFVTSVTLAIYAKDKAVSLSVVSGIPDAPVQQMTEAQGDEPLLLETETAGDVPALPVE